MVSALVVAVGLAGMIGGGGEPGRAPARARHPARALGASPRHVLALLAVESVLLALAGIAVGLALLYGAGAALCRGSPANTGW